METTQYYYPPEYLREPLEAYLRLQATTPGSEAGAIRSLITTEGQGQKQTLTSDEETSLIHAAYLYYNINYDTPWLQQDIEGLTIIERLNRAADWLYTTRLEPNHQLLWRDPLPFWGDIPLVGNTSYKTDFSPDQRIISIYDQALAYLAFIELATMNAAVGDTIQADAWQNKAESLKKQINNYLWNNKVGYYPWIETKNEDLVANNAQISIANALAVYGGLSDFQQNQTIFESLEWARTTAGVSKPGLSLYPYNNEASSGFVAGESYNGGVWDWWAGLQIQAEFFNGFAEMGQTHLLQVVNEWQKHPGNIIEWQASGGTEEEGSHYHLASAGTMGSAIIKGFFGVQLTGEGLSVQPRLGLNDGFIRVYQPTTDRYAAYSYDWNQDTINIAYGTNASGPVQFQVLKLHSEHIQQVTIDGQIVPFTSETVGLDTYTTFTASEGQHQIEISKGFPPVSAGEEIVSRNQPTLSNTYQPSVAPNSVEPRLEIREGIAEKSSLREGEKWQKDSTSEGIALRNTHEAWAALLRFVSTGWVILTSLILMVLAAIRRFSARRRVRPMKPKHF
jgi:hypothetical protein